jgi:hypothetical protein
MKQHDKQHTSHRDEPENSHTKGKGPKVEKGDQQRDETHHHPGKTRHKGPDGGASGNESEQS